MQAGLAFNYSYSHSDMPCEWQLVVLCFGCYGVLLHQCATAI